MNISSLGSSQLSSLQFSRINGQGNGNCEAGGVQGGPPPGGKLDSAVLQALSDIGIVTGDSSSSDSSTTTGDSTSTDTGTSNIASAFQSFMHTLMSTLHAQSASGQTDSSSGSDSSTVGQVQGDRPPPPPGGAGRMESDLESLIQKLSSSSTDSSSSTADSGTSDLQSSFQNLLTALGATSSADTGSTLNKFLQALETRMQGASSSGNVVNTTA